MISQTIDHVSVSFYGVVFRAILVSVLVLMLPTPAHATVVVSPQGLLFNAQSAFSGGVATFTSNDAPAQPASAYSATISWGDGSQPSAGTITGPVG